MNLLLILIDLVWGLPRFLITFMAVWPIGFHLARTFYAEKYATKAPKLGWVRGPAMLMLTTFFSWSALLILWAVITRLRDYLPFPSPHSVIDHDSLDTTGGPPVLWLVMEWIVVGIIQVSLCRYLWLAAFVRSAKNSEG